MSKLAFHVGHFKRGEVGAIDRHNRRLGDNHTNEDIDPARTPWNIAVTLADGSLWSVTKAKVEDLKEGGARVTAGSVYVSEWVVYPPEELQDPYTADRDRVRSWAGDVLNWLREQSIEPEQAIVHFDESTVHMHIDTMPITADGRLSRKDIYTRSALVGFHTGLADYLSARGWDIQRGDSTAGKHIKSVSAKEYKRQQEKNVAELERRTEALRNAVEPPQRLSAVQVKESTLGNSVKLSKGDYEALKATADACGVFQADAERYRALYERERERSKKLEAQATLGINDRVRLAEGLEAIKTLEQISERLEQLERKVSFVDKLISVLPAFIGDKLRLRELERSCGVELKDYYDLADTVSVLREVASRAVKDGR